MKKTILLIVLLIAVFSAKGQNNTHIYFNLDKALKINQVKVRLTPYEGESDTIIYAIKIKKNSWKLTIPDAILDQYILSSFYLEENKRDSIISHRLSTKVANGHDTLYINNIYHLPKGSSQRLNLTYSLTSTERGKSEILYEISDPQENERINAQISSNIFTLIGSSKKMLAYFNSMHQTYPNSSVVARWAFWFLLNEGEELDVDCLREFYNGLSETDQNTYFGQKFFKYIESRSNFNPDRFQNMMLPENKSGAPEYIIQDTSIYNLVIFSHSACGPCHEMIPLLKEIYADLKGGLEITYISADDKKFVDNWKKVMEQNKVPWRSLLAVNDLERVRNTYQVRSFPTTYLVHPGGRFENLDLRKTPNKEKLYELIKNSNR